MRIKPKPSHVSRLALTPLMLFLLSTCLYFVPYLVGGFDYIEVDGRKHAYTYHAETGWAVAAALVSIVLMILLFKPRRQDVTTTRDDSTDEATVLLIVLAVFGAYTLATPDLLSTSKSDVLEATDRFHFIFYNACILGVTFGALAGWRKHKFLVALSGLGLLLILYIGHRSTLAITVAAVGYVTYRDTSLATVKKRYIIGAILLLAFLAVYKSVYAAIKAGNYYLVGQRLEFDKLSDSAMVGLEQFVTFAHLDLVVLHDYTLPCSNLWLVPFSFIPFMEFVFGEATCGFNEQVQPVFFPGYSGGVAANIWAEFYANFGYIGLPLLVIIVAGVCAAIEAVTRNVQSLIIRAGLIVSIIQFTLYIQRKELLGAFISAKRALFVALLIAGLAYLYRHLLVHRRSGVRKSGLTQRARWRQ